MQALIYRIENIPKTLLQLLCRINRIMKVGEVVT